MLSLHRLLIFTKEGSPVSVNDNWMRIAGLKEGDVVLMENYDGAKEVWYVEGIGRAYASGIAGDVRYLERTLLSPRVEYGHAPLTNFGFIKRIELLFSIDRDDRPDFIKFMRFAEKLEIMKAALVVKGV